MVRVLATGASLASAACTRALRAGDPFRVHQDTVTREGALRVYALRAQTMQLERTSTIGVNEALKDLADSPLPRLRIAAVSGARDYTVFMDPECRTVVACLGVDGRPPF
jgi:hypothetical protein